MQREEERYFKIYLQSFNVMEQKMMLLWVISKELKHERMRIFLHESFVKFSDSSLQFSTLVGDESKFRDVSV